MLQAYRNILRTRPAELDGTRSGQVMAEYVIVAGILATVVVLLALMLYVFKEYGGRILDLLAADFP